MLQKIILAGHSQSFSLGLRGLESDCNSIELEPIDSVFSGLNGPFPRSGEYWDALVANCRNQVVALTWQGSQHYSHFMFIDGRPFDFHCSCLSGMPLVPDAYIVPERMVRTYLARTLSSLSALLSQLGSAKRVVLLGTPPPKGDNIALKAILMKNHEAQIGKEIVNLDSGLILKARDEGIQLGDAQLTDPTVMLKLWAEIQDLMHETARKHDADFMPFPTDLVDRNGFLRREYWAEDVSHTNRKAGAVFLDQIRDRYAGQLLPRSEDPNHSEKPLLSTPFSPGGSAPKTNGAKQKTSLDVGMCSFALQQKKEIDHLKVEINTLGKRLARARQEAAQLREEVKELKTKATAEDHNIGSQDQ